MKQKLILPSCQGQTDGTNKGTSKVPLGPAAQNCISPWSLGPAGAMCAQAAPTWGD